MPDVRTHLPAAPRAIFVSYSHDDAAAARRLTEALRAAGLEVWFDENELRSGDTWDAKIKQQIRDCALFLPVISHNTQRRREGYFRLEWHLAEERSRLIARGTPFLVPVAIDDTGERAALVPEVFLSVQWTRLRDGEATAAFGERVKALLAENDVARVSRPVSSENTGQETRATQPGRRVPAAAWIGLAAAAVIGVVAYVAQRPSQDTGAGTRPPTSEKPVTAATSPLVPATPRLGPKSIAVLPFENLSEAKDDNASFTDGMHVDVISNLSLIAELRCVPRATALTYRGTKKSPREIADELGVARLLNATVQRAGAKVRITATLLNPRTDEIVWNRSYDKNLTETFAIQSELAQAIAAELRATLSPQETKFLARRPTENTAAYDLFLKARGVRLRNEVGREFAVPEGLLREALALDPRFASAWSELSWIHGYAYYFGHDRSPARLREATVAADHAAELASDDPETLWARGYFHLFCVPSYALSQQYFAAMGRLQPNAPEPHHALASARRRQGKWREALAEYGTASRLDPGNFDSADQVAYCALSGRRWDEAQAAFAHAASLRATSAIGRVPMRWWIAFWARGSSTELETFFNGPEAAKASEATHRLLRRALLLQRGELDEILRDFAWPAPAPEAFGAVIVPITALAAKGRLEEARQQLAPYPALLRAKLQREPLSPFVWADLGMAEAVLGHSDEALASARKAVELVPPTVDASFAPIYQMDLAFVQAWLGDRAGALAEYARVLQVPNFFAPNARFSQTLNVHVMRHHPFYFPLQGDPRFEALLKDPKNNAPLF